ncbi:MAG: DNA internalization-related competence protein ComEC/Rec2 [Burkholderiales bacterium]|nr:DNA internalization-related competence protein ComEC/Rec2 [Burkholderiales bacterium]OJX08212.1 MAG: DNA internalization-related competence protein ComEC/Rec2 [Burkholderiales bacterium 70-64]
MSWLAALLRAVPLPVPVVAAALLVHRLPALPGRPVALVLLLVGLLGLAVGIAGAGGARRHAWRLLAVGVAATGWTLLAAERGLSERLDAAQEGRDFVVEGRVASMPIAADYGTRFAFDIERCLPQVDGCPDGRRVRLSWSTFGRARTSGATAGGATTDGADAARATADERPARGEAGTPRPGERWRLNVRLKRPHALHNPGVFDAELRALEEGIAANGYVRASRGAAAPNERLGSHAWSLGVAFEAARARLREAMQSALRESRPDAAGVLVALVVGDQAAISTRWWEIFNKTAIGHLMSISGLHITMLAGLSVLLARRLLHTVPVARSGLLLRWPAGRLAWLAGIATAFLYSGLAGWGIPAQRTCWMLAVAGLALFGARSRSMLYVLSLAAAVVTLLDPWAPLAAGFWLSFASVAAITLHGSGGRLRTAAGPRVTLGLRAAAVLREAAGTQWAATLALLPLGALFFSSFSLVGPLANAVAIPLVSAVITPLAMLASALLAAWPAAGGVLLSLAAWVTGLMLDVLEPLAAAPLATVVLAQPGAGALAMAAAAIALLLWPVPLPARRMAFAGLLPLLAPGDRLPAAGEIRLTAFDVGQGMAVLVETPERRLLYDTGPLYGGDSEAGARVIVPWLRARGIDRLDALVVSHLDSDHSGGAPSVLRNLRIDWIAGSLPPEHPLREAGRPFHDCRSGHGWRWGEVDFEFLHPGPHPAQGAKSPTNASSCVLRIVSPAARLLLTGDIEAAQERSLLARHGAPGLAADLMLAPHHGSGGSSSAPFLEAVAARHAIVQAGYRNRFRHPAERALTRYRDAGIAVLRSDRDGAIVAHYAVGRAPRIERTRIEDRRYWRIRLPDDLAAPG